MQNLELHYILTNYVCISQLRLLNRYNIAIGYTAANVFPLFDRGTQRQILS